MDAALPTLRALAASPPTAAGYLIDLDGTLASGSKLLPGALDFLANLERPFVILSNDSEHVEEQVAGLFEPHGLHLDTSKIVLAGVAAVESIAERFAGARVLLLASDDLVRLASKRGLTVDSHNPEIVLVARDRGFTFDKLALAAKAIASGARLILACPDLSHPGPDGEPIPEAGALAAALLACTGYPQHEVIGKPEAMLFKVGCQRLGISPSQCIMIGDNPLTDGLGADRAGVSFLQIKAAVGAAEAD